MQDNQMLVDEGLWKELKALVASIPASWFKYSLTNLIQEIEAAR